MSSRRKFWTDVKDSVPEIGQVVFVTMYEGRAFHVMARGGADWKHVTHWAPIPHVPDFQPARIARLNKALGS